MSKARRAAERTLSNPQASAEARAIAVAILDGLAPIKPKTVLQAVSTRRVDRRFGPRYNPLRST